MTTSTTTCWPRETLRDYLSGWIPEEQLIELESHLESCSACEQTLHALEEESDTLCELLKCSGNPAVLTPESATPSSVAAGSTPSSDAVISYAIQRAAAVPPLNHDRPSDVFHMPKRLGPYDLLRSLGSGGMGAVYLAKHRQLQKMVAIKLLPARAFRNDHYAARFQREIRAAGQLQHPAVVSATDAGEEAAVHYLVMEYIDGLDISRIARAIGQLPIAEACEIIRTVALGLSHAHARGIVHRDVKPSNIMLSRSGEVKILDFGLAQVGLWDDASAELTTVGQLMGTLDYMAPEQAEQPSSVDYRADLYSLGATLFRLLCGRAPLAAAPDMSPMSKLRLLHEHPAPSLSTLRSDAPAELVQLVDALLQREPERRPASAAHVAEALAPLAHDAKLTQLIEQAVIHLDEELNNANNALNGSNERNSLGDYVENSNDAEKLRRFVAKAEPQAGGGRRRDTRRWGKLVAFALVPLFLFGGILLTLELQKGQLIIDSTAANVQVKLLQDGQVYERVTVQPGANVTRVYAGKYEIVIDEGSDRFQLEQRTIAIQRGDAVVVRLTERESSPEINSQSLPPSDPFQPSTAVLPPPLSASIEPGDKLEIASLGDPQLTESASKRETIVTADYSVKFPWIGVVSVKGMNPQELEVVLNQKYASYVREPGIEVYRTRPNRLVPRAPVTDTGVATLLPVDGGEATTAATGLADELMYEGQTLNAWLDILRRERSPELVGTALRAVQSMANADSVPYVTDVLLQLLPELEGVRVEYPDQGGRGGAFASNIDANVWGLLSRIQPDARKFGELFVQHLETGDMDVRLRYWTNFGASMIPHFVTQTEARGPITAWMIKVLRDDQSPFFQGVASLTHQLIMSGDINQIYKDKPELLDVALESLRTNYWLAVAPEGPEFVVWNPAIIHKVESEALKVLADKQSSVELMTSAAMMLQVLNLPQYDRGGVDKPVLSNEVIENLVAAMEGLEASDSLLKAVAIHPSFSPAIHVTTSPENLASISRFSVEQIQVCLPTMQFIQLIAGHAEDYDLSTICGRVVDDLPTERIAEIRKWLGWDTLTVGVKSYPSNTHDFNAYLNSSRTSVTQTDNGAFLLMLIAFEHLLDDKKQALREQINRRVVELQLLDYDRDQDGRVSITEYPSADLDGDGWVSVDEYKDNLLNQQRRTGELGSTERGQAELEWAKRQIAKYDVDMDGQLSMSEIEKMIIKPIDADLDGNGFVTVEEFANFRYKRK